MKGYLRPDGRKGILNTIVVAYLIECARHVTTEITFMFREGCPCHRLSRLFSKRICFRHDVETVHTSQCRSGTFGFTGM